MTNLNILNVLRAILLLLVAILSVGCETLSTLEDNNTATSAAMASESNISKTLEKTLANQPTGGNNTISFTIGNCVNCAVVNVLIDPDGYWQRTESTGVISGQSSPSLYNAMVQSFAASGLYNWPNLVNISPAVNVTCPDYIRDKQVFFLSIALAGERRQTIFDSGCAGSDYVEQAITAINAVSSINLFQNILSGRVQSQKLTQTSPSATSDGPNNRLTVASDGYPLPPSLKPWGG